MKKFWEKHSLGKVLTIILILAFLLTWVIPTGSFNGSEYVKGDLVRIGLADLGNMLYYVIAIAIDKILFLIVLGIFYSILTKIPAYEKVVNGIAKKMKGKEILFACIVSFVLALFASFSSSVFAVLVFVPFVINILSAMKFDKISVAAISFGSVLVGELGCIFGTEGLFSFNQYLSSGVLTNFVKDGWVTRMIIFIVAFALFTVFNIIYMKKALKDKKAESMEDPFAVAESKGKTRVWPLVVVLAIVALLTIIGSINWYDNFGIEAFVNFHTWLTELSISDHAIFSYILGSSAVALGTSGFSLFTLISILLVFTIILVIMGRFSFDEVVSNMSEGTKKMTKVILPLAVVYSVFAIFYLSPMMNSIVNGLMKADTTPRINIDYNGSGIAYFNIDTNEDGKADKNLVNTGKDCKVNCDTNKDGWPDKKLDFDGNGKVDEKDEEILDTFDGESVANLDTDGDGVPDINVSTKISYPGTILTAIISSVFHVDFNYNAYSLSQYFVSGFAYNLGFVFLVMVTMFGLVAVCAPTSALLVIALSYTDLEYSKWLKYIWKFLVCTFVFLLIVYAFVL